MPFYYVCLPYTKHTRKCQFTPCRIFLLSQSVINPPFTPRYIHIWESLGVLSYFAICELLTTPCLAIFRVQERLGKQDQCATRSFDRIQNVLLDRRTGYKITLVVDAVESSTAQFAPIDVEGVHIFQIVLQRVDQQFGEITVLFSVTDKRVSVISDAVRILLDREEFREKCVIVQPNFDVTSGANQE